MNWMKLRSEGEWCGLWSRLHGYFKDSLTLCYKIQSTKIAIICITAFLVWLSYFLISHQWDWAWCTSNQVWYFWLFCSPRFIFLPLSEKKDTLNTNFQKAYKCFFSFYILIFFYFNFSILFLSFLVLKLINAIHFSPWNPIPSPINGKTGGINKIIIKIHCSTNTSAYKF